MLIFSLVLSQVSFASNENQASSSESDGFWDSFDVRSVPRNCLSADNIITDLFTFFSRKGTTDASNSLRCYYESYGTVIDLIFYSIIFISLAEIGLKNTTHITESKTIPIALGIAFGIGTTIFGEVNGFSLLRDSGPFAVLLLAIFFVWLLAQLFEAIGKVDTKHAYTYSYALVGILLLSVVGPDIKKFADGILFYILLIVWVGCAIFAIITIFRNLHLFGGHKLNSNVVGLGGKAVGLGGKVYNTVTGSNAPPKVAAPQKLVKGETVEIKKQPNAVNNPNLVGEEAKVKEVNYQYKELILKFSKKSKNKLGLPKRSLVIRNFEDDDFEVK